MDMKELIRKIWEDAQHDFLEFTAEADHKCCPVCKEFDGMIFRDDDPNLPQLPLHPNCRCTLLLTNRRK